MQLSQIASAVAVVGVIVAIGIPALLSGGDNAQLVEIVCGLVGGTLTLAGGLLMGASLLRD